jgi:hypothetical protein
VSLYERTRVITLRNWMVLRGTSLDRFADELCAVLGWPAGTETDAGAEVIQVRTATGDLAVAEFGCDLDEYPDLGSDLSRRLASEALWLRWTDESAEPFATAYRIGDRVSLAASELAVRSASDQWSALLGSGQERSMTFALRRPLHPDEAAVFDALARTVVPLLSELGLEPARFRTGYPAITTGVQMEGPLGKDGRIVVQYSFFRCTRGRDLHHKLGLLRGGAWEEIPLPMDAEDAPPLEDGLTWRCRRLASSLVRGLEEGLANIPDLASRLAHAARSEAWQAAR